MEVETEMRREVSLKLHSANHSSDPERYYGVNVPKAWTHVDIDS